MPGVYTDSDVSSQLARILLQRGYPARTARDEDRESARDPDQLLFAAAQGWTFVTHNRKDFRLLHDAWHLWSAGETIAEIADDFRLVGAGVRGALTFVR